MNTYYTFKERNEDGELVTPRDDPMEYEFSINFVWDSMTKALTWLNTDAEDWGVDPEESNTWLIVKVTEEVVYSPAIAK